MQIYVILKSSAFQNAFQNCCNKMSIHGHTQTYFFVRASEHLAITPLTGKHPEKSTIFDHVLFDGHKASFGNFSIHLKRKQSI